MIFSRSRQSSEVGGGMPRTALQHSTISDIIASSSIRLDAVSMEAHLNACTLRRAPTVGREVGKNVLSDEAIPMNVILMLG